MNTKYKNQILNPEKVKEVHSYTSVNVVIPKEKYIKTSRQEQSFKIEEMYHNLIKEFEDEGIEDDIILNFEGEDIDESDLLSLDDIRMGIRILNITEEGSKDSIKTYSGVLRIPYNKISFLDKKISKYKNKNTNVLKGNNDKLLDGLSKISKAKLKDLWTSNDEIPDKDKEWCEIWLMYDKLSSKKYNTEMSQIEDQIVSNCQQFEIKISSGKLVFNERLVKLVHVNYDDLINLMNNNNCIAEIRKHNEPNIFYTDLNKKDQLDWLNDLKNRLNIKKTNSYISLFDTGINNKHLLLEEVCLDENVHSVDPNWTTSDEQGHGTKMAGICAYYDLANILSNRNEFEVSHSIESMKILPDKGSNDIRLYGDIMSRSLSILDIEKPNRNRLVCMAVTSKNDIDNGTPSSWSAEIDKLSYDNSILFIISAGNLGVSDELYRHKKMEYPEINDNISIHNPAQSWNAIVVGAFTEREIISEEYYKDCDVIAKYGILSPHSTTSVLWDDKNWPMKPDVVCEGGNVARDRYGILTDLDDLSLLTLSDDSLNRSFESINGTSAATAQVAFIGARLMSIYPNLKPETIRALIIHSAKWSEEMIAENILKGNKKEYNYLLSKYGHGVPSLSRALNTLSNRINIIMEDTLVPFKKINGKKRTNEMNTYDLPWPKEVFESLGEEEVKMTVTLSYFIEPSPGQKGWANKYRYSSSGLRFDLKSSMETKEEFLKRINKEERNKEENLENISGSDYWLLGPQLRSKPGSIHKDVWEGSAVDLASCNMLAVYPVIGWWREQTKMNKINQKLDYSLIITIESKSNDIDIYSAIKNKIDILNKIESKNVIIKVDGKGK